MNFTQSILSGKQDPHLLKSSLQSVSIEGALTELIENGIQFTADNKGKKVVVLTADEETKTVTIYDNGKGMRIDQMSKVDIGIRLIVKIKTKTFKTMSFKFTK
jgi:phosphoglycerate-specific signal transduction histidine kinase